MSKVLEFRITAINLVRRGVQGARRELEGLKRVAGGIAAVGRGIGSAWGFVSSTFVKVAGVVAVAAAAMGYAVKKAFEFEGYEAQFRVLMGSMSEAKARMKELAEFAAVTPFELPEIVRASRQMHVLTEGLMGGAASLRMVGDAAAATGANIEEVALWVGRAYSMIKAGRPFGEAAMRLQELGILGAAARNEMESLQATGASSAKVWGVLSNSLKGFAGGMLIASTTGDGLLSTLKDGVNMAVKTFGQAFEKDAKGAITSLIGWLDKLAANGTVEAWAQKAREALQIAAEVGKALISGDGRAEVLGGLADVIIGAFQTAVGTAVDLLIQAGPVIGDLIGRAAKAAIAGMGKGGGEMSVAVDQLRKEGKLGAEGRAKGIDRAQQRALITERTNAIHAANLKAEGKEALGGDTWAEKGKARLDRGMDTLTGFGRERIAQGDVNGAASFTEYERARKERQEKKKGAADQTKVDAQVNAVLDRMEETRKQKAIASIQAIVKKDQDAAAAMIEGKKAVQKAFETARDAEVARLQNEGAAIRDNAKLSDAEKTAAAKAIQDKIKAAQASTLNTGTAKPWEDLLKAIVDGMDNAQTDRLAKTKRIEDARTGLVDRRRENGFSAMDPKAQAVARQQYIAVLESQMRRTKDAEKRLELEDKILSEQEKIAGLTKKSADAWKSASLGDIFSKVRRSGGAPLAGGGGELPRTRAGQRAAAFAPLAKSAFAPLTKSAWAPLGGTSKSFQDRHRIDESLTQYQNRMAGAGGLTAKKSPEEETAKNTKDILAVLKGKPVGGMKP